MRYVSPSSSVIPNSPGKTPITFTYSQIGKSAVKSQTIDKNRIQENIPSPKKAIVPRHGYGVQPVIKKTKSDNENGTAIGTGTGSRVKSPKESRQKDSIIE